jgi:DNA-binding transcriptional LysR family regulator
MVVGHAIAALEARHETKLFDRIGRRIALTEAGRVFLMEARAFLARAGAAELALSEFGTLKRGTLCVQVRQTGTAASPCVSEQRTTTISSNWMR